jgi:uncharacterized membrane protein (UPF0182 family)
MLMMGWSNIYPLAGMLGAQCLTSTWAQVPSTLLCLSLCSMVLVMCNLLACPRTSLLCTLANLIYRWGHLLVLLFTHTGQPQQWCIPIAMTTLDPWFPRWAYHSVFTLCIMCKVQCILSALCTLRCSVPVIATLSSPTKGFPFRVLDLDSQQTYFVLTCISFYNALVLGSWLEVSILVISKLTLVTTCILLFQTNENLPVKFIWDHLWRNDKNIFLFLQVPLYQSFNHG